MVSSVSAKDEICFLRVCHHVSKAVYCISDIWKIDRKLIGILTYLLHGAESFLRS